VQKTDFRNMWGASVLGIASSWAVFGFLVSSLHPGSYADDGLSEIALGSPELLLLTGATIVGGAIAGLLSQSKWLPAFFIALCMTLQLNDRSSIPGFRFEQNRYLGEMIVLFISATFGHSLTRRLQANETQKE